MRTKDEEIAHLKAKLKRTKAHMLRKAQETERVEQAIYDELFEENKRLRAAAEYTLRRQCQEQECTYDAHAMGALEQALRGKSNEQY